MVQEGLVYEACQNSDSGKLAGWLAHALSETRQCCKYVGPYRRRRESVVKYVGPYRRRRESVVKYMGPYRKRRESVVKYVSPYLRRRS